jgi:GDP-4-dehydro-6-deoxy-D-mannose reductase
MRLLLTGATGFLGRALVAAAGTAGVTVVRATRATERGAADEIALGPGPWLRADFSAAIAAAQPDAILHAAGTAHSPSAAACFEANTLLAAELLDAVAGMGVPPRLLLISSAAELGFVPADAQPVTEAFNCAPRTAYAIAKYAQTLLGLSAAARGLPVLVVRLFNPVGPGMPAGLALPSFARQIMDPATTVMRVGDLSPARDFIDVAEAARILVSLAAMPRYAWPLVNLCSGQAWRLGDLLGHMIALSGRSLRVEPDPALQRPGDMPVLRGDTSRLAGIGLAPQAPNFGRLLPALLRG